LSQRVIVAFITPSIYCFKEVNETMNIGRSSIS